MGSSAGTSPANHVAPLHDLSRLILSKGGIAHHFWIILPGGRQDSFCSDTYYISHRTHTTLQTYCRTSKTISSIAMVSLLCQTRCLRQMGRVAMPIRPVTSRLQPCRPASTAAAVASSPSSNGSEQPFFPDEPRQPIVKTKIPGPKSEDAIQRLTKVFDTRSLNMMADYKSSFGN